MICSRGSGANSFLLFRLELLGSQRNVGKFKKPNTATRADVALVVLGAVSIDALDVSARIDPEIRFWRKRCRVVSPLFHRNVLSCRDKSIFNSRIAQPSLEPQARTPIEIGRA